MMSLSKISRFQATNYYTRDDYYTRQITNEDFWYGKALSAPFAENISQKDSDYQGQPRVHVNEYTKTVSDIVEGYIGNSKRLALDLTFSPPKSVSIAALDQRYEQDIIMAHNAAITTVLNKIEREIIIWRKREDSSITPVRTGNMLAACLQHKVSRDEDPQLHTHVVLFRKTITEKGIGTIEDKYIFKSQRLLSAMYDAELSYQLQRRGFKVSAPQNTKGDVLSTSSFEITGIAPELINHFSNRRQQVLDYLEKHQLENTPKNREKATLKTRKNKRDINYSELKANWVKEIESLGGIHIEKSLNTPNYYLQRKQLSDCFKESVKNLSNQEFAFRKEDLQSEVLRRGVTIGISESDFEEVFSQNIFETIIPMKMRNQDGQFYFTTQENLKIAKEIDDFLSINQKTEIPVSPVKAKEHLLSIEERLQKNNGWTLSPGQRAAIQSITSLTDSYMAIQGYAGTGKTTMLQYTKEILDANRITIKGMAFTGKAAQAIRDESGIPADTIHGFLNKICNKEHSSPAQSQWDFSTITPRNHSEVWIVDESSMINDRLLHAILDASHHAKAKVVFIGDKEQLLPIGTGNGFNRMVENKKIPVIEMHDINRQKEGTDLKKAIEILAGATSSKENSLNNLLDNSLHEIKSRKSRINRLIRDYLNQTAEERDSSVILVGKNTDRALLNNLIRKRLQKKELLPNGKTLILSNAHGKSEEKEFSIGERIMFLKNDRHITTIDGKKVGVMNGQTGVITSIKENTLEIKSSNAIISVNTSLYNHLDYAYAMTSHKAQGITVKRAFIYHDSTQRGLNHKNRLYVDISRAKEAVFIYTDNKELLERQAQHKAKKLSSDNFIPIRKFTFEQPSNQLYALEDKKPTISINNYKNGAPQTSILVSQSKKDITKHTQILFNQPKKVKDIKKINLEPMPQKLKKHIGTDKKFVHNKDQLNRER